jgi:hypothetical protein
VWRRWVRVEVATSRTNAGGRASSQTLTSET